MISILKKIGEAINSSRTDETIDINEEIKDNQGRLFLKTKMSSEALNKWQLVSDEKVDWLSFEFTDSDFDIIQPSCGIPGEQHIVKIHFPCFDGIIYLLTPEGWSIFLHDDKQINCITQANLLFTPNSFNTYSYCVKPWLDAPNETSEKEESKTSSKTYNYIKKFTNEPLIPSNVEPWLLKGESISDDESFIIWKRTSNCLLALTLINEVYINAAEEVIVTLSGKPPKHLVYIKENMSDDVFNILQESVLWVYLQGDEVEIKHTFLSNELAREWPLGITYNEGLLTRLSLSLQSARLLYKAHIRSSSKETIKTLSELRKTLTDDVSKIISQTKDIATTVWKDLALALGTIVLKYATDATKFKSLHDIYSYVYYFLAIYILISFFIPIYINKKFNDIAESNRLTWRVKLYGFLDESDYENLASKPIEKALKTYKKIILIGATLVVSSSITLIMLGFSESHNIHETLHFIMQKSLTFFKSA